jgi:nucleoside-diphosphate-sugar epimerase
MRVMVIGGSGFIGTHLVAALQREGHEVAIFDAAPSAAFPHLVRRGDVRDGAALIDALRGFDAAIDLAAEHRDDVEPASRYAEVNVGGARNLAAAAVAAGVTRLLFVSSVAVYGRAQPGAGESHPLRPDHPYGASKAEAEAIHRDWQREDPTRALTIVRPTIVYGEGHRGNLRRMIEQLRAGRFALLDGGRNRKSIAYVGNLVDFLASRVSMVPGAHCFNFADPPDPTTAALVDEILALLPARTRRPPSLPYALVLAVAGVAESGNAMLGRSGTITRERVRRFRSETTVAVDALLNTGYRARFDRSEGLRRTIAHSHDD